MLIRLPASLFRPGRPLRMRAAVLLLLAAATPVRAHDFWIEPGSFRPAAGATVPVNLRVGMDFNGTSQPLIPNWFTDYSVTGPDGQQPVAGMIGDDPAGHFTAVAGGSQVIGYRSTRAFVEIDPPRFNQYLDDEGLEWVRTAREQRGEADTNAREYYSRCAKSLVRVAGETDGRGYDVKLGYTLELIPGADPYGMAPGAALPVRLLYQDRPLPGALVIAFTAEQPDTKQRIRTDDEGRATVQLDRAGTWLIKAVHIIEVPQPDPMADWESFWASLTFRLAGA